MNLTDEQISMVLSHADSEYFGQRIGQALVNSRVYEALGISYGDKEERELNTIDELCDELCKNQSHLDELGVFEFEFAKSWVERDEAWRTLEEAFNNFHLCDTRMTIARRDLMRLLRQVRK